MENIRDIIKGLVNRVNEYDKHDVLNPIDIQFCKNCDEILTLITNLSDDKLRSLVNDRVLDREFLYELFGEDVLTKNRLFCGGERTLFGGYKFIAFGDAVIRVSSDAEVAAFGNAKVYLTQNASLNAYDNVSFEAKNNSQVIVHGNSYVTGSFHDCSKGNVSSNNGRIDIFNTADVRCIKSTNVSYNGFSSGLILDSYNVVMNDNAKCDVENSSVDCYGNSCVNAKGNSRVNLYEGCFADVCEDASAVAYSANKVIARDYANVTIKTGDVGRCEAFGYSTVRIMEMGVKFRGYDHSTTMDFTDKYTESLDYSTIIWMNTNHVFKNQKRFVAKTPFIYPEDAQCPRP